MKITKQQGSSIIEFTIVIPFLLMLVVAVSEFGVMFYRLNAITKSVNMAARYLSNNYSDGTLTTDLPSATKIKNLICYGSLSSTITSTSPPSYQIVPNCNVLLTNLTILANKVPTTAVLNNHVQVSATYPASWILPQAALLWLHQPGSGINLTATSVMRFSK